MRFYRTKKPLVILGLHSAAGVALAFQPNLSTFYGIGAFFYFFITTLATSNRTGYAHLGAAYLVGLEVLLRMTKASVFWEFGKWGGIVLLTTGILIRHRKGIQWRYLIILALLAPSILITTDLDISQYRKLISAQLAGEIFLVLASVYFGRKLIEVAHLQKLFRFLLNPIATTAIYLFIKTPSLSTINFTTGSNFSASGGFGPNQVSTILGLGSLVLAINYLARWPHLYSPFLDKFLLVFTSFRGLLTFSRGGIMSALAAIFVGYFAFLPTQNGRKILNLTIRVFIAGILLYAVYAVANKATNNMLSKRFSEKTFAFHIANTSYNNYKFEVLDKFTSNRASLILSDIRIWIDHPILGVGVGKSKLIRPEYGMSGATHTEQTRLLAEHGIFGLTVLFWMLYLIGRVFYQKKSESKLFSLALILFSFLTMLHSATRLAAVGFTFGLALAHIYSTNKKNE